MIAQPPVMSTQKLRGGVRVIHQINGGLGRARNAGLCIAEGEYIGFVDADDYVKPEMFQKLYGVAVRFNAEIATCNYYELHGDNLSTKERFSCYGSLINLKDTFPELFGIHSSGLLWFVWKSIYQSAMLKKHGIVFTDERIVEDSIFNLSVFAVAGRMAFIQEPLYIYDLTDNLSLTRAPYIKGYPYNLLRGYEEKIKIYQSNGISVPWQELKWYTMEHTLPTLIMNAMGHPNGLLGIASALREIRNCEMIEHAFQSISVNVIKSNLKYIAFLLRSRLFYLAGLALWWRRNV